METRAAYVAVGTFVLVLIACLVVAVLWLARLQLSDNGRLYDIYFGSVAGLDRGSSVRQNGVPIGSVIYIRLDPQDPKQVRVTVDIRRSVAVKADAVASLELQGLTGGAQIEITGGSRNAPLLEAKDDQPHPVIASSPSSLQQVVNNAPELLARANTLLDQLSNVLNDNNRAAFGKTLDNLQQVTGAAAAHSAQIGDLFSDGAASAHELRTTLEQANKMIGSLNGMVAPGGDLSQAIKNLNESSRELAAVGQHLDQMVQENRPGIRDFTARGLTQFQQLLRAAQTLVANLSELTQSLERDPSQLLYGNRRRGYQPQ